MSICSDILSAHQREGRFPMLNTAITLHGTAGEFDTRRQSMAAQQASTWVLQTLHGYQ